MKIITTILLLVVFNCNGICQSDLNTYHTITVAKLKNGSAFIELGGNTYSSIEEKFWISSTANISLQNAFIKAKKWALLNEDKKIEFVKEVVRFRFMDKDNYESFGNVPQFTREGKLSFYGQSDGSFSCELSFTQHNGDYTYFTISNTEYLDKIVKMLQGKSIDKTDEIFN